MYARFLSTMALAAVLAGTPSHAVDLPLAAAAWQAKVHPRVFVDTATGQRASVVVLLADQADLSTAQLMRDADARGRHVYRALTAHAARSQAPLRRWLEARGIRYRAFWAANLLVIDGDRDLIEQLARRSDTRAIESNAPVRWVDEPPTGMEALATGTAGIEWGVGSVNAPAVWAMGYTGQGIVVAGQDSGVQWDHPALRPHYRGWNGSTADHNYNWHDAIHDAVDNPCGNDAPAPCDDLGHGTHTIGTIAGDDGNGNQIGVAPGARWIGCRNMDSNFGTPERYTECFQFFIAPTDQNGGNPDPTRRPHVINNSWVCPPQEGCAADTLAAIVHNTEAAGILVVASAGNAGPDCSTISDPPALYSDAFSVGAYDSTNTLAGFSSRGPVTADGSNRPKPDIVAPGVNVRSAYPPDTYNGLQGTSMAGPHVVGVVALLWSAQPRLARDIAATKALLEGTAHPDVTVSPAQTCGGISTDSTPNNAVGYGRIDALAAVNAALLPTPTPSPTDTPDPTVTGTPTVTPSATATNTATQKPVPSPTSTATPSPTPTNTPTPTGSATATPTSTATTTPTVTRTPTPTTTPSPTATRTQTATNTPSGTPTATPTFTPSPTPTATATQSATGTATNTTTPTSSPTATSTPTPTSTVTRTATSTPSSSPTGTHAPTPTRTPTASPTSVPSATVTPTYTGTSTPTASPSPVPTQTSTVTPTSTATATRTPTATLTATAVATATPTPTPSSTPTVPPSPTTTATHTATLTATATATPSATAPPSATPTPTPTRTPTSEATATPSPTATVAPSPTPTAFPSATQTVTRTATRTPSATPTPVPTKSPTSTPTASDTPTPTVTKMPTASVTSTPTPTATGSPTTAVKPDCVGQCTARAPVTVSDIVTMVNIALGNASIVTCPAGDADSNGQIAIDEILLATYNALHGCPTTGLAVAGPM